MNMMKNFVSTWSDGKILPENYIFPSDKRPGKHAVHAPLKSLPVIDLAKVVGDDHDNIVHRIMKASQEFGFFQVINHGVPIELMEDTRNIFKEFFELPAEEKTEFCSGLNKICTLLTSNVDYEKEDIHNWRDSLRHCCTPLQECIQYWPQKPATYRDVVGDYTVKTRELGSRILELICEGLGFEPGYFATELSHEQVLIVHHYPPCPDPSLTLGTRKHCDPGLLTILLQGNVGGFQVMKDGEWVGVDPIPNALLVNVGQQLQIISNGKLVSVEHRVVTNKDKDRFSAALFIEPTKNCYVQPANEIVSEANPAIYKGVGYGKFLESFRAAYVGKINDVLEPYTIST